VLAGAALAADQRPVEPGGKIGAMTVVRGDHYNADEMVWVAGCETSISKAGNYHRSCVLPKLPRLYIGTSWNALTQKELDNIWKYERWRLWVDGRPVDLPRFGTSDTRFRLNNGKRAFSRSWRVILVGAPSGKHTIRYLWRLPSGATSLTLAVTVEK
jgi:hypothetical protein